MFQHLPQQGMHYFVIIIISILVYIYYLISLNILLTLLDVGSTALPRRCTLVTRK